MSLVFLDFETRSAANLKKVGADVYARHPSTGVLCTSFAFDEEPLQLTVGKELHPRLRAQVVSGGMTVEHNSPFELAIWNECCVPKYGWPRLEPEQTICTMSMAYAMALPGALADAANAVNLPENKDSAGHRVMMQLSQPRKGPEPGCLNCDGTGVDCPCTTWYTPESHPEKFEALYAYCKQDVEVERQLYKRILRLSAPEQAVWLLDRKINDRGVQVDLDAVRAAIRIVEFEKDRMDKAMREATNDHVATCTATGQLAAWLGRNGVETKSVDKASVLDLLSGDLPDDCRRALELRQEAAKSSTAKLEAMLLGACDDGRLRGMFQYHGAMPGRFAGRRVQLHNMVRSKMPQEQIEEVFGVLGALS